MALYDYRCSECGATTVVSHSVNDTEPILCECGKEMRKIYSAPATLFPGTGWGKDAR